MLFVLDSTPSMSAEVFSATKDFVRQFIGALDVSDDAVRGSRVGLVAYSKVLHRIAEFTDSTATDADAFSELLDDLPRGDNEVNTPLALLMAENVFRSTPARPGLFRRVMVVISDSDPNLATSCIPAGFRNKAKFCSGQITARIKKGTDGKSGNKDDVFVILVRIGGNIGKDALAKQQNFLANTQVSTMHGLAGSIVGSLCKKNK